MGVLLSFKPVKLIENVELKLIGLIIITADVPHPINRRMYAALTQVKSVSCF